MRARRFSQYRGRRSPLGAVVTIAVIALIAVLAGWLLPAGDALVGRAYAVDGDTLRIGESRIRLLGLDAVELDQSCSRDNGESWACGEDARRFLRAVIGEGEVSCAREGRDRYGRVLARCRLGSSDLGEKIVRAGWAVADLEYGLALADARLRKAGIWSGGFDDPAGWRRNHGEPGFDFLGWLLGLFNR